VKTIILLLIAAAPMFGQWSKTTWGMSAAEVAAVASDRVDVAGLPFRVEFTHDKTGGLERVKLHFLAKIPADGPGCRADIYKLLVDKYGEPEFVTPDHTSRLYDNKEWLTPSTRIVMSRLFCSVEYSKRINTEEL